MYETEELPSTCSEEEMVEIYVSSISDPSYFFVQKVGPTSIALDKLGQEMSAFYDEHETDLKINVNDIEKGSLVAAKYSTDENWYRAMVNKITIDDYDDSKVLLDIDFVDFGDFETKDLQEVCHLKEEFLKLKFQAIPATLADVKPIK